MLKLNRYIIYILPRSGMSCPSDANYCFGAGSDYSSSTVIQGNECRGGMCSMYGIRVNNRKIFTGYNVNVKYEFFYWYFMLIPSGGYYDRN